MLKQAIEKANKLAGGWPEDEAIISQLEGMGFDAPSGYLYIRPDNHQGYKDAVTGFSKNNAGISVPDLGSEPDHHHSDPQHHGAGELAEARPGPQRVDRGGRLDQEDLAEGHRLGGSTSRRNRSRPPAAGAICNLPEITPAERGRRTRFVRSASRSGEDVFEKIQPVLPPEHLPIANIER